MGRVSPARLRGLPSLQGGAGGRASRRFGLDGLSQVCVGRRGSLLKTPPLLSLFLFSRYMTTSYAIRITLPYADISGIISSWADRSDQTIVYQHDPDEKVKKTHVHLALYGVAVKSEALKRMWPDAPGKGNEFWSWKDSYEDDDGITHPVDLGFITYGSKGHLRPVFVKNISPAIVEEKRKLWVERSIRNDKASDPSERLICKILEKFANDTFVIQYIPGDEEPRPIGMILDRVRSESFRQLWAQHRKVPHAAHYKIIAGTAFLRLCERLDRFEEGAIALQNLWY